MNEMIAGSKKSTLKITHRSVLKAVIAAKSGLLGLKPALGRAEAPDSSPVPARRPAVVFDADVFESDVFE